MGNSYLRDEFKRHKNADSSFIPQFTAEWTSYYNTLKTQALTSSLGKPMEKNDMLAMNDQQLGQLYELKKAAATDGKEK